MANDRPAVNLSALAAQVDAIRLNLIRLHPLACPDCGDADGPKYTSECGACGRKSAQKARA